MEFWYVYGATHRYRSFWFGRMRYCTTRPCIYVLPSRAIYIHIYGFFTLIPTRTRAHAVLKWLFNNQWRFAVYRATSQREKFFPIWKIKNIQPCAHTCGRENSLLGHVRVWRVRVRIVFLLLACFFVADGWNMAESSSFEICWLAVLYMYIYISLYILCAWENRRRKGIRSLSYEP